MQTIYDVSELPADKRERALTTLRTVVPTRFAVREAPDGGSFRCVHCGKDTDAKDGGSDLLPYGCSECWCKATQALQGAQMSYEGCPHCGRYSPGNRPCAIAVCDACGTPQCFFNGMGRGTCKACLYGFLRGWSRPDALKRCQYKGCTADAVYIYLPGAKKAVCREHAAKVKIGTHRATGRVIYLPEAAADWVKSNRKVRREE